MSKFSKYKFLFLDRDGVINKRIPGDYVKSWEDFEYTAGALKSLVRFKNHFQHIIIVTNQQGVGKGLMSQEALDLLHEKLKEDVKKAGGKIDAIFACTELDDETNNCRKPSPAMAIWAKYKFPAIDFERSIMIGDSVSDIKFGQNLGMYTVLVEGKKEEEKAAKTLKVDKKIKKMSDFSSFL